MMQPSLKSNMLINGQLAELHERGFCVLKSHFPKSLLQNCRDAFWPILLEYIHKNREQPNRGAHRHFVAMPFDPPCFLPEFFFDPEILNIVRTAMDDRVVADQWGSDSPLIGSTYQDFHVDYQHPLFPEIPDLSLPPYMMVINFGLIDITAAHGPIEIAPGTHKMPRQKALNAVKNAETEIQAVTLELGDVLIRHPWALHRGTPNLTEIPRPLLTIRYVRQWYADFSRDVMTIPSIVWKSLIPEQQEMMRFPRYFLPSD